MNLLEFRRLPFWMVAAGVTLFAGPSLAASQVSRCSLRIEAPTRNSVGVSEREGAYTTYLGGGTVTLWCGDAVMTGDSAVHFESEERAEMIGNVVYRDTTRTLEAHRLTYFERIDQIIAEGDVRLVRLATGARLDGPRVSFFRAATAASRSTATERSRMTFPASSPEEEPILIDSDVAEFLGNEQALARGNVVIRRSDFHATADSARFSAGESWLYGDPVVTSGGLSLAGDSIFTTFTDGELDRVHALGNASATGEDLDLRATEILIATGPDGIERAWAFGFGRSLGATGNFVIAGDSLDFAFADGEIDSVTAVGEARAFHMNEARGLDGELREPDAVITTGVDWIEGDSIHGWFESRRDPAAPDSARREMRRLLAQGSARSLFSGVRDSTVTDRRSRNYMLGASIDILFVNGEPDAVIAKQAIGVFLEPTAEAGGPARE